MANNSNDSSQKFFDVTQPNKSTPPATSRPIITANRPPQLDPMITTEPQTKFSTPPPLAPPKYVEPVAELASLPEQTYDVAHSDNTAVNEQPVEPIIPIADHPKPTSTKNNQSQDKPLMPSSDNNVVVAHHKKGSKPKPVFFILLTLLLVIIALDVLLDAGVIKSSLPHTNFIHTN